MQGDPMTVADLHTFSDEALLERDQPDTIMITVSLVGERVEVDVFEDEHIEISRFRGDESVESGMGVLLDLIKRETDMC